MIRGDAAKGSAMGMPATKDGLAAENRRLACGDRLGGEGFPAIDFPHVDASYGPRVSLGAAMALIARKS
jgi:hypothetical protein